MKNNFKVIALEYVPELSRQEYVTEGIFSEYFMAKLFMNSYKEHYKNNDVHIVPVI